MKRAQVLSAFTLGILLTTGCEEKPAPAAAGPEKTAAAAPPPAPAPPAPTPSVAAAPKPKKQLADCPKGPEVTFDDKELEGEVRRKLPKPEGVITNADLGSLRSLNLSRLKLPELDVCLFSQLKGLKELFLGPGDYDDLGPIAAAKQLESLRASISQVKDLKPLEKLTRLDRLDLGRTQVSDLAPLAALTKLTELQLDDTQVEDVTPLARLTLLETLSLKRTKVKDVAALKGLKKLKILYTAGSGLDADPMSVAPLRANGTKIVAD